MTKPSARTISPVSHRFHVARTCCQLAALTTLTASMGCSSEQPNDLPLKPCGVEETIFGDEDIPAFLHRTYDDDGNLVLSERDTNVDGVVDDRFVWQYAPGGGLTRIEQSFSSGTMHELAAQYGEDDRLEFVTWMTSLGMEGHVEYDYDGAQRIIERWDRDNDGVAEQITTYTYDANGTLQGSTSGCADEVEPRSMTTLQWGEDGRIERIESSSGGEPGGVTEYSYNQDGLLERIESSYGGMVSYSVTYEYDSRGNVRSVNTETSLAVTNTEYDADGRILSSRDSIDGEPFIERIYLYECPGYEDSPGRHVGAPRGPLPSPPRGPRAGVGMDGIYVYALSVGSCL